PRQREQQHRYVGRVGMTGEWATKPIAIYGRNLLSGTYEFFKQTVLYGGDYKESVKQLPGWAAVVESVAKDKFAIGYSGVGYKTAGFRTVPLATYYGSPCYDTSRESERGNLFVRVPALRLRCGA